MICSNDAHTMVAVVGRGKPAAGGARPGEDVEQELDRRRAVLCDADLARLLERFLVPLAVQAARFVERVAFLCSEHPGAADECRQRGERELGGGSYQHGGKASPAGHSRNQRNRRSLNWAIATKSSWGSSEGSKINWNPGVIQRSGVSRIFQ